MRQLVLLGNDQYGPRFSFRALAGYRRFAAQARRRGWEVVATSWDHLSPRGREVAALRGVVSTPQGSRPIEAPLPLRPDYLWDGTVAGPVKVNRYNRAALAHMLRRGWLRRLALGPNPLGLKALEVESGNLEAVLELLDKGLLPSIVPGSLPITMHYLPRLMREYWPRARYSRSALFSTMGKHQLEACLGQAEAEGAVGPVPRPPTRLAGGMAEAAAAIEDMLAARAGARLIVKDSGGTRLEGIFLLERSNRGEQLRAMASSRGRAWLVQPYLEDTVLFHGRKADVRIFVGVFGWEPLQYRVYRQGMTRVAWKPWSPASFPDPGACLTTRQDYHTLEEYFTACFPCGPGPVWRAVEQTVGRTLAAVVHTCRQGLVHLRPVVKPLGFDLMFTLRGGQPRALLVEINHLPMLYSDKVAPDHPVNLALDQGHGQFFRDFEKIVPGAAD